MRSDVGEGETKSETVSRNAIFIHLGSYVETSRVWPRRDPAGQLWEGNGIIFCLFVFVLFLFCFIVLDLMLRSLINSELVFVYGVR